MNSVSDPPPASQPSPADDGCSASAVRTISERSGDADARVLARSIAAEIGAALDWDERYVLHVSLALYEAITNAVDHGNLGLSSELICADDPSGDPFGEYQAQRAERLRDPELAARRVEISYRFIENGVAITVRDEGAGFDAASLPDPNAPENLVKPYGRGLWLIRSLMNEVYFDGGGTCITLVKRVDL